MIALGIIILIIVLLLLLPLGADAAYGQDGFKLKLKIGPAHMSIIPSKEKKKNKKEKKPKKAKAEKAAKSSKKPSKPRQKLSFEDIMGIIRLALKALGRFRRSISVDLIKVHITTAGPDPYSAVMNCGYINAAIGAVLPLLHRVFKVKKEDYETGVDFDSDKLKLEGRVVLTVRVGEILLIALCAGIGFLKWRKGRKARLKAEAQAAAANEKITENSSAEKGN